MTSTRRKIPAAFAAAALALGCLGAVGVAVPAYAAAPVVHAAATAPADASAPSRIRVLRTVDLGEGATPGSIAISGGHVFAIQYSGALDRVYAVSTTTGSVDATISVPHAAQGIVKDPVTGDIWVSINATDGPEIVVVSPASLKITGEFPAPTYGSMSIRPGTDEVWMASTDAMYAIDARTHAVLRTTVLSGMHITPSAPAFSATGSYAYIGVYDPTGGGPELDTYDAEAGKLISSTGLPGNPYSIAASPSAVFAATSAGILRVVGGTATPIGGGVDSQAPAILFSDSTLYSNSAGLEALDPSTGELIASAGAEAGSEANALAFDDGKIWVADYRDNTLVEMTQLLTPASLDTPTAVQPSTAPDGASIAPTLTLPAATGGVEYSASGDAAPNTTVTVTATAKAGYVLQPSAGWKLDPDGTSATMKITFGAQPVAPVDPVITQATRTEDGTVIPPTVTLPTSDGVSYSLSMPTMDPEPGETVTIEAFAKTGYVLASAEGWTVSEDGSTASKTVALKDAPSVTLPPTDSDGDGATAPPANDGSTTPDTGDTSTDSGSATNTPPTASDTGHEHSGTSAEADVEPPTDGSSTDLTHATRTHTEAPGLPPLRAETGVIHSSPALLLYLALALAASGVAAIGGTAVRSRRKGRQ